MLKLGLAGNFFVFDGKGGVKQITVEQASKVGLLSSGTEDSTQMK